MHGGVPAAWHLRCHVLQTLKIACGIDVSDVNRVPYEGSYQAHEECDDQVSNIFMLERVTLKNPWSHDMCGASVSR